MSNNDQNISSRPSCRIGAIAVAVGCFFCLGDSTWKIVQCDGSSCDMCHNVYKPGRRSFFDSLQCLLIDLAIESLPFQVTKPYGSGGAREVVE